MAFLKKAYAAVVHPGWGLDNWGNFIGQNRGRLAGGPYRTASASPNLVAQASEILQDDFNPKKYLLTHSTIVASVDTEDVPNVKLGAVSELGRQINRKWSDYHITPETEGWINNNCFVPGTLITMADGTVKPIEEVREGDEVLSHLGRARKVRAVMRKEVDETIREIKPRATTDRIYATGEHPFFVFRENMCPNCGAKARSNVSYNSRCATHLIGKFYCSQGCWHEKKIRVAQLLEEKTGEFVEARNLTDRDFVTMPVLSETETVDVNLAQARLIGLFAAEGYYELDSRNGNERVGVIWAFHSDEAPTLAKTVCDLMRREFGVECVVREHSNDAGIHVTTKTNRDMVSFFSKWVHGDGAKTKVLHKALIRAPHDVQMEVVRGWMEGDGCFQDTAKEGYTGDIRVTGSTACRSLASQMQILLNRLGVASRLTRTETCGRSRLVLDGGVKIVNDPSKPENVSWAVACGGASISALVQDTVYESPYLAALEGHEGIQAPAKFRYLNGYELQIIQSIREVDYTGPVYNFDVEEDHSYVANGVAVHNCDAWSRPVLLKSYRTFIGGHNFCFVPGTRVLMADGSYRPIETVEVGDEVVTHEGRPRKVTHRFERVFEGNLQEIHVAQFERPILATENHPFRVKSGTQQKEWVSAGEISVGTSLLGPERYEGRNEETLKQDDLAWWGNCRVHRVAETRTTPYVGTVYNLEVEEDHSYVVDHGVAVHNCEHVQIEEQSKGRIIDAVARDIGPSVYIDILTATDRKHSSLIQDIEAGRMSTLSMGCSVTLTACTKCGNAAADETEMCEHVKFEKGNMFFDASGNRRKVAELCGHESIDPTGGVTFIEASWVAIPAFPGAVMRNIIESQQVNVDTRSQMRQVLSSPPHEWTADDNLSKAAGHLAVSFDKTSRSAAELKRRRLGGDDMGEDMGAPPGDDMGAPGGVPMDAPGGAPMDPGGGMPGMPGAEPEKDPMEEMEDALEKYVLDKVQKRLEKKMQEEVAEDATSDPDLATSTNENINHQASLVAGARAVVRTARSDVALLDGLARLNESHGVKISRDIYRTALRVGSTDGHPSLEGYLQRCAGLLDRTPTLGEAKTLVRLGRILSLRKKTRS